MAKTVVSAYGFFLGVVGLILLLSGIRLVFVVCIISGLGLLMWGLTRKAKPSGESPSGTVSCCHYLGEVGEESSKKGS